MEPQDTIQARVRARDSAMRLLRRLTAWAAISAFAGVGLFGAISANTIPGAASTSTAAATSPSTSSSTASGLATPTTPVTSSSSSGVAVSGGS